MKGKIQYSQYGGHVIWLLAVLLIVFPLGLIMILSLLADADAWDQVFYRPTYLALRNSYGVFFTQSLLVIPCALVVGSMSALFDYPFRRLSLLLSIFPLVLPSFIAAIGLQSLNTYLPYEYMRSTDGFWGCVWTGVMLSFPLAAWGTFFAVKAIPRSEIESVLQLAGVRVLLWKTLGRILPATVVCACLAGLVGMSDFGVSNIMGFHGVASEIQISFATRFDFVLAAAKACFILLVSLPILLGSYALKPQFSVSRIESGNTKGLVELPFWIGSLWSMVQFVVCTLGIVSMLLGLLRPFFRPLSGKYFGMIWERYVESLNLTLFYGLGSGVLATLLGFTFASYFFTRVRPILRYVMVLLMVLCFILPSAITALGMTWIGTQMPASLDVIFRSEWVVLLTMGIRFAPVAVLMYLLAYALMPTGAGEVVRMVRPPAHYSLGVLQFWTLLRWGALSLMVTSILTLADVGAMTLVQPPSGDSFGSYFFGSMDNSAEVLVSSMCVVYMVAPLMILGGFLIMGALPKVVKGVSKIAKI